MKAARDPTTPARRSARYDAQRDYTGRMLWQRKAFTVILLAGAVIGLTGCAGGDAPVRSDPPPTETTTTSETPTPDRFDRDPDLAAELASLIVEDLPPLDLRLSDRIPSDCAGIQAGGCYSRLDDAIYLSSELDDFRRPELLAHEYLHYVWDRDDLADDTALTQALDRAYDDDEGLGSLVPTWQQSYTEADGSIQPTELFSYACTGLRSDQLDRVIARQCERYLRVDELPVNQRIRPDDLLTAIDELREAGGQRPFTRNPHAEAASEARAETITPHSQVPLSEFPDSVRQHLTAGCSPSRYGTFLTRPYDDAQIARSLERVLQGGLTSSQFTGIGVAVVEYDYIDARALFGDRTIRVNASLVVVTLCE